MKSKIRYKITVLFLISITNTHFLQAHNSSNGGCKKHCKESVIPITRAKDFDNKKDINQIEDNFSCLTKSLCRG